MLNQHARSLSNFIIISLVSLLFSELFLRICGFTPWVNPEDEILRRAIRTDHPVYGWIPNPHPTFPIYTGEASHSETILPDSTRRVLYTAEAANAEQIIITGDSSIYGWGVSDEDSLASQLAVKVPTYKVLNVAVPAYGALQASLRSIEFANAKKTKYVILGYTDMLIERDAGLMSWILRQSQITPDNNLSFPYATISHGTLQILPPRPSIIELPWRHTLSVSRAGETLLTGLGSIYRHYNRNKIAELIFLNWSDQIRHAGAIPVVFFWANDRAEEQFGSFLISHGIVSLQCKHPLQGSPETVLPNDGHPSPLAIRYWANCIESKLLNNKLLTEVPPARPDHRIK